MRPRRPLAVLAALAAALAATPAARAGVPPAYGGTVRVALPAAPRTLDPARALEPSDVAAARALHAPLLEVDARGRLAPGLLAEVPAPEAGGRAFRLVLAPGLRFSDGTPLAASDVAASLGRLLAGAPPPPHAWVALPILGADAVLEGRAAALAGVQVLSPRELLVTLAFPLPEFPWALATLPAAVISPRGAGAGPFVLRAQDAGGVRLSVNPHHHRGRAFADGLVLAPADARGAARALAAGEVDLVLRPEAAGSVAAGATPALAATVAVLSPRLGPTTVAVRATLAELDRADLARRFVRGPAAPLDGLVPPALLGEVAADAPPPATPGGPVALPGRLVLLVPAGAAEARAAADRLQVRLFDRGVRAAVEEEPAARFAARLEAGDHGIALATVPLLPLRPALAAGQLAYALRGPGAGRLVLAELAGLSPADAAARARALAARLDLVPLFASGLRASAAPALQGAAPGPGGVDVGGLWLLGGAP